MAQSPNAIALLSSGLDSSVALWLAQRQGWKIELALTLDYGQRAAKPEIRQAAKMAERLGVRHRVLALPWFSQFTQGGALISPQQSLPKPSLSDLSEMKAATKSKKAVWVPNRNGVFLEIAAGIAEDSGASSVVVGFNAEEAATFPDNSLAYLEAMNAALRFSTQSGVRVISPTVGMDKNEIVKLAKEGGFPFSLLWSCYEARDRMCGRCESCMRLKRALTANQVMEYVSFEDISLS